MDQRQLEKERIRITREIATLEAQLDSAIRGKEEKLEENKQIKDESTQLEEENKGLEEETRRLDEEISQLDEEFKQAQVDAGRLRREIKVNIERADTERKKITELQTNIAKIEKNLEVLRREIKTEIEDRRSLESKLRKTNSQIEAMKTHKLAGYVTKNLEKQDWYRSIEEPVPMSVEPEAESVQELSPSEPAAVSAPVDEKPKEKKSGSDGGGIDFSTD
jgi:chromosome segregation ATPase